MDDKDKRYFSILVNFYINMYRDSGEIYYLHKAAAEINAVIKKKAAKFSARTIR